MLRSEILLKEGDDVGSNRQSGCVTNWLDPIPIVPILEGMVMVVWSNR
jgi:hypothetical protein